MAATWEESDLAQASSWEEKDVQLRQEENHNEPKALAPHTGATY